MMTSQVEKAGRFRALHETGLFVMPNAWDVGSARILESLGFEAIATTSSGFAATLGRRDYGVTRDEAIAHAAAISAAVAVPVSADLEDCFAPDPAGVAETLALAVGAGLAGCSVEDATRGGEEPLYDVTLATERVAAAAEVAHQGPVPFVLTARCEAYLHGDRDFDRMLARLLAYERAGADVLFAPGVVDAGELRRVVEAVSLPVNVLALPGVAPVAELEQMGVRRVSVGGGLAWVAYGAAAQAAVALRDGGTFDYLGAAAQGSKVVRGAMGSGG